MSVPVNQRSHGKLEAYAKAYELATYTLKITKNKKIFTEEYQDCLTDHIISAALDIYMCTGTANGKQVRTEKDKLNYEERIAAQRKALDRCGDLLKLIMLAKPIFHLSSKRVKYWTGLTKETRTLIKIFGGERYASQTQKTRSPHHCRHRKWCGRSRAERRQH